MPRRESRFKEEYDLIVYKEERHDDEDIIRQPTIVTKAVGIRSLDDVDHIRHMFSNESVYGEGVKVSVGRTIHFWCHACRGYIGSKTIPLRIEPFRSRHMNMPPGDIMQIKVEDYRCDACGHHTRFKVQDPVLSVY